MATISLSSKSVGDIVKINENSGLVDFIVLQHGYPTSGNGRTLLIRKDIYSLLVWNNTWTQYRNSNAFQLANSYVDNLDVSKLITNVSINSAGSSIQARGFLLSFTEMGMTDSSIPVEGNPISYFYSSRDRVAQYNGRDTRYWTRTSYNDRYVAVVQQSGTPAGDYPDDENGLRPAFTLPSSCKIDTGTGQVLANQPPTTPSSITFGTPYAGKANTVTCGASTDPDGDSITYVFERQVNSGVWTQIRASTSRSFSDTTPSSGSTVNYRVKARDSQGAESAYRTGTAKNIIYNQAPPAPASISYGIPYASETLAITCSAVVDPNGDQVTYVFERQVDSGGWVQIASSTSTTVYDTVPNTGTTYTVRVKAQDPSGAASIYTTGATQTIAYPLAITTPGKPAYKYAISGDTMKARWSPAAAPGGTQITYTVETQLDGGQWTQAGQTVDTSYQVTVPTVTAAGSTLAVRVKASTTDGSESDYATGDAVSILWHKVVRRIPWEQGTPFKARQFTTNAKNQYQTKLENALADTTGTPSVEPDEVFGNNSPAQIAAAIAAGTYKTLWSIGDEIVIPFSDGNYVFRIADFDHDQVTSDTRKAAITLEMEDLLTAARTWNNTATNAGAYGDSALADYAESTLLPTLPEDWRDLIVPVDKIIGTGGGTATVDTVSLQLFPPTAMELFGAASGGSADEGTQYPLYATAANRIKSLSNGGGEVSEWWTASPVTTSASSVCTVSTTGTASSAEANGSKGVCLLFAIGYATGTTQG